MNRKKRTAYHHGSLRADLLSKALELLVTLGGPHFTMRDLAKHLGVSHSAAYRHFKDKDALFAALAVEGFQKLAESQQQIVKAHRLPLDRLKHLGLGYIKCAGLHAAHFRVMFRPLEKGDALYEEVSMAARGTFEIVVQETIACQTAGKLRKGDPIELAQILWSTVHGLSMLMIDKQLDLPSEASTKALAINLSDSILRGLQR